MDKPFYALQILKEPRREKVIGESEKLLLRIKALKKITTLLIIV
jgi:hypothetical protein